MNTDAETRTVHERIALLIRMDIARTSRRQADWAELLGLGVQQMSDRMRGRTAWSLADAMNVAKELKVDLDTLVGIGEDLVLGFELAGATS